jgi:catechol 2,3-dioxygenase-like lactoylglutathione lyase family enzyme
VKKTFSFGSASGEIFQLGIVVPNLDAAVKFYVENLHIGPFICARNFVAPAGKYRGETVNPRLSLAHVFNGKIFIELIQQHDVMPSVYAEHVEKYGYGLHHFGLSIAPEDYDDYLTMYYANGFEDVFTDHLPSGARIKYIAPKKKKDKDTMVINSGVGYFECVEVVPGEELFFNSMRQAAESWDHVTIITELK